MKRVDGRILASVVIPGLLLASASRSDFCPPVPGPKLDGIQREATALESSTLASRRDLPQVREERLRVFIETDAGGDPDDEQSLVRFLLYANEFNIEGILCARPMARDKENINVERTGLGIVRRTLKAYGACHPNLIKHDRRFPTMDHLWQ